MAPIRAPVQQTRMVTAIRQPTVAQGNNVIVSTSQPPALHPVYPNNQQIRAGANLRQPMQVRNKLVYECFTIVPKFKLKLSI